MTTPDQMTAALTDRDHVNGVVLPTITDELMRERLAATMEYTLMTLRKSAKYQSPEVDAIVWEHGRRNFALREHGTLAIVMPVIDDSETAGIGIFDAPPDEVVEIMNADPGVQAGIFTYEVQRVRGFPGSSLPALP
jgi:YCII-related domain